MTKKTVCDALNAGQTITDIGQLDRQTKAALVRAVKRGEVIKGVNLTYPNPKTTYTKA